MTTTPNDTDVHWYYPSSIIGCGLKMDDMAVLTGVVTSIRAEVTCPACRERLENDKKICARCAGQEGLYAVHTCDPAHPDYRGARP